MPDWLKEVIVIALPLMLGGGGWLVKRIIDGRDARESAYRAEIKDLQAALKEQMQERLRYEIVRRESVDQTMAVLGELIALVKAKGLS